MARETRGSAASDAAAAESIEPPAPSKRKRQPSTTAHTEQTNGPLAISLKVTLPAQAPTTATGPKVRLNVSPTKGETEQPNGAGGGVKRQRISLKVKGSKKKTKGVNGDEAIVEVEAEGKNGDGATGAEGDPTLPDDEAEAVTGDGVKEEAVEAQESVVRVLGKDVRDALALVLSRMALGLPRPLNTLLNLFLPPHFTEKPENTLGVILQQDDLTWDRLVDLLHTFSTHLLQPIAYPSPFPPLSHIHTSVPPLAPHQPYHPIYAFCVSMRDIVLSVEPRSDAEISAPPAVPAVVQKWGLMMKVPGGNEGRGAGEWWTGIADWREAEKLKGADGTVKGEEEESLLERLAADGNKFGYANAVSIASLAGSSSSQATAPKLGDSLVRIASLKAQRWKEQLARRKGGFGSIQRPVSVPVVCIPPKPNLPLPWTPSFAPTFDSNYASGGAGYWTTLEAMHQRNRYKAWTDPGRNNAVDTNGGKGYWGCLDLDEKERQGDDVALTEGVEGTVADKAVSEIIGAERQVEDVLKDNAEWLDELLGWQEDRIRRGEKDPGEREQVLAEELLNSLSTLTSTLSPSALLPTVQPGFAHTISRKLIHTPRPIVRGTLDPRRPRAIHDNATIRPRPSSTMPPIPSMSNPPSIQQQLAGTPNRSAAGGQSSSYSLSATGYGGTPTPSSAHPGQSRSTANYAYASTANGVPSGSGSRSNYSAGQVKEYKSTLPPPSSRSSYPHTPFLPGLAGLAPQGNTIYSNRLSTPNTHAQAQSGGQQGLMSPSLSGGGSPSPTLGAGPGYGHGQYAAGAAGRPSMMPSGLRQSFGPETSSAPVSGTASPVVHGQQQQNGQVGYFSGMNRG